MDNVTDDVYRLLTTTGGEASVTEVLDNVLDQLLKQTTTLEQISAALEEIRYTASMLMGMYVRTHGLSEEDLDQVMAKQAEE